MSEYTHFWSFFFQPLKTVETIWGLLHSSTYLIGHTRRRKKRRISYWLLLPMTFYNSNSKCIETSLICKSFSILLLPLVGRWVNFTCVFYVKFTYQIDEWAEVKLERRLGCFHLKMVFDQNSWVLLYFFFLAKLAVYAAAATQGSSPMMKDGKVILIKV